MGQESLDQFEDALESLEHDPYESHPALQHLFFLPLLVSEGSPS